MNAMHSTRRTVVAAGLSALRAMNSQKAREVQFKQVKEFPQRTKPAEELSVLTPKGSRHEDRHVACTWEAKDRWKQPTRSCEESPCCKSGGTSRRCSCHRYWHSRPARTERWNSLPFARRSSWDLCEHQKFRWFSAEISSPWRRGLRSNRPRTSPARPGHWLVPTRQSDGTP